MTEFFEQYFADYAAAFNRFDAEAIDSFFQCPCLMVSSAAPAVLSTADEVHANTERLLAFHRAQGFGRASFGNLRVQALGTNLAFVDVDWQVERADGAVLWTFRNSYNVGDFGNGWKILASTTHGDPG